MTEPPWETLQSLSAVVLDPTLGLVGNNPVCPVVLGATLILVSRRGNRELLSGDLAVAAIGAALFLFSFSRTTNVHRRNTEPEQICVLAHSACRTLLCKVREARGV